MRSGEKRIIQFLCYTPRVYSSLDKFIIRLSEKQLEKGLQPVAVYTDNLEEVPELEEELRKAGIIVETIESGSKFRTFLELLRILRKHRPQVLHAHFDNFIQLSLAILSILLKIDFFISFRSEISDLKTPDLYRKTKGWIKLAVIRVYFRFLNRTSKKVVAVSDYVRKQFILFAKLSDPSKVITIRTGIHTERKIIHQHRLPELPDFPSAKVKIVNISAIEYIKGLDIALKALGILKTKYLEHNFLFCHIGGTRSSGGDPTGYETMLKQMVEELELAEHVYWLGIRKDISETLALFDIYIHPSRQEAMGFANMEAASQSLPIIGSDSGGIPEIVRHGINGFIFPSENAEELAFYLHSLILDQELRERMGGKSLEIVRDTYDIEKQTDLLNLLYSNSRSNILP